MLHSVDCGRGLPDPLTLCCLHFIPTQEARRVGPERDRCTVRGAVRGMTLLRWTCVATLHSTPVNGLSSSSATADVLPCWLTHSSALRNAVDDSSTSISTRLTQKRDPSLTSSTRSYTRSASSFLKPPFITHTTASLDAYVASCMASYSSHPASADTSTRALRLSSNTSPHSKPELQSIDQQEDDSASDDESDSLSCTRHCALHGPASRMRCVSAFTSSSWCDFFILRASTSSRNRLRPSNDLSLSLSLVRRS